MKKSKKPIVEPGKLAYHLGFVAWEDANYNDITYPNGTELGHAPVQMFTGGWILRDDENGVSVGVDISSDGSIRHVTFIPRCCVIAVLVSEKDTIVHLANRLTVKDIGKKK